MNLSPLSFIFFLIAVLLIIALVWWLSRQRATPHVYKHYGSDGFSASATFIDEAVTGAQITGGSITSLVIDHADIGRATITECRSVGSGVFFLALDTGTSYWYVPGLNHLQEVPQCETAE